MITLAGVENGDLPSGRRHSVRYVLENACSTLFSIPSEVVSHTMKVLAMLSLNAKIFSSLSEWDSFLNQEDTLGVYNIQRDFTKWIWFVSSNMKKLAKAVFVRHGGYTRDGFSTELVSILMSTLTCEPPLENFLASIMETYSSSFPSSERLSTSTLASLFCPNPASFWFSVSLLSLLLLFYRAEPSAAFLLYVPILEFVCKTDTKAYRRKLQVLMTKVLQSSMCHSVVSLAEQMQRLVECCNQETTSGVEKKKLMVVVPKKVVDVLDRMVGRRVGGKNLSPEEGGETGAHRRAVDLSPEKISYSFAPSSPSSTRGAAPTCIVLDGEEWQEVSFHWLFFMDAEVLSNEVEKKQNAAVEGSQNVTGLSTSLHELFRIAVLQKGVDGSVWESETQTYTTVDDAASAIVTFAESVWRTKGKNELFIPSISTKKKSAARAEEAAIRLTFRRRVLNMLLPILRGHEGRANADFFASPERLLATDGWVAQQDIDAYIEGKLQLSSESYSVQDFPQWISEYVAHHDLLGRLEWMEKGRRVRATHAHATSAKDLYQRIIQTKEMLWTFEERAYFSFSRFEKAQEAKEIVTDASNTLSCAVPFSPRPPSRYAWVYCTSPLQKEIRLILRKNMYTAVSVPGVKLLLPATVVAAQQYPKVFSTDEQMDKDFRTPPQAPTSTAPSSAPPADECRDAFQCMKKIKLGRRVQEDAPVEHSEAAIRDDGFTDEEEEEEVDCVVQPCVIPQKKGFLEVDLVLLQECYDIYACPSHKVVYGCRRGQKSNGMAQHENIPIWCFTGVYQEWAGEERVDIHLCSSYVSSFPSSLCVASPSSANGTATISILECGRLRDQYLQKCAQKIEKYTKEKEEEEKNSAARVPNEPAALPNDGDHTAKHEGDNTEACLSVEDKVRNLDEVLRSSIQLLKIRVEKFLMEENETVMELDLPTIVAPFRKQALKEFKLWLVEKKLSYVVKDGDCKAYNSMCTKKTLANQVKLIHNTLILSKESVLSDDQLRALYREAELPDTLPMELLRRALNHTGDNWNNYEEHEFIGDAVLGCVVAVDTFLRHCHDVRRSHAVCGKEESSFRGGPGRSPDVLHSTLHRGTVALCCENAVLAYLLPRSLNQLLSKLSFKAHADILEALIGVLYDAECGMDVVRRFIQRRFQFLSSLLKEEKGTLVPLSLPVPSSPSETSNTGKRTVLQPPLQRLSEYKKLKVAWELCPYRDDAEGENEECCGALGKSMEATLQVIGVSPSNTPPPPHPSPFSLFGFAYGNLIHVLPSDCCLPSMVEKKGENDMAFGVHDEDNARRKTAHVTDLNPLSCYNSMRGFSRVSFSSHATHFTSGDIFCYRRIYEEEVPHVRSRVIAGAETLAGNGQSCMTFINELFTPFMRFVVDYDSSNILSWNFFRHFLEWTALQEARGGGWRPESESKAGPHEHVHRPSHEAQREGKEEDVVAEKEGRRTETNAVVHPHFRAFAAHPGSPPKVLVASSCSSEKDSYHIHVLHWIIPTAAYARIVQDLEQFIWTKRCRLIVAFRDAVEKCQKVFPVLENMNEGEWWGPSGVEKEEVCGEGTSSQHGSPLENTRHLWLPFLDGPTLIRLQHAFDPPAHAQDGKNEEEDEKTTTKHHHHNKKQGGSTRFGRMVTHFLKSLSPYDAARLLDVPPSHIFLGEVEKTTQRHTYGVYYFFQSAPCDTTTPPPSTTGTARVVVTSRWILGNTILQHWKDFCHAPLPFASSTERYVPPVLPSGASPANLSMWERFWFSYIDPTLKDSQKLRQVYCDKFDMRKGRQYRPFFPYCLASTTPAYAGFAGGREGNGGKMDGFWCDGHGRIDTPSSSSSWTPLTNATTKTTTVTIQDGSAGRHPMDALLSSGGTRGAGAEPSKGRPHERQVVFPPHTLYSVKITPSASFCSFSPLSMPICWPSLSIFPQPPRTNPTPQAYYLAQRAREKEIADREREGKNYPKEKVDPTHTMEDDGIIVPMPSLHSLHWSRVRRLQQGCVLVGGMRSPILPRLKTKICAMLQDTRSPSQDGASLERQVEFSCAVVRSPPPPVWAEKDGMRSGDASHVTVPQSDPHQEEETNGCTCMVRWENDDEENDDEEEEEEEAPHLWPVALHRRAVWSAHDQNRLDGRPTTTTITTGGGGPSVTIAAMDILHATSLRQPFLRDVQGRLYSSWNVLASPAGKGNRHWETMESTEWNKGPARYPPSVIASLANGKEEWWDSCAASLLSLCAGPRFCMSNKITKAKTSVASHRLDGSRPSFIASVEKKKEEDQTEHVDDDGDVPSRGIFLEHWRWGESDAMAPPAQWNVAGSADLYGFDWDRCEGEAKEQCAMAAPSLSSGSNMKRARNEEEDENKGKSMLLYPTTTFTTARTTTALAPWTQLSSLLSPPNHFQSWLTNMFVLTRTYQPPLFLTNYLPIKDWMDEKLRAIGNATAKPQCLHPMWLEQDCDTLQWRLIVYREVLFQTSPSLPRSPVPQSLHESHPPSSKETYGSGNVEKEEEGKAEERAAHKLCLMMQRLMQVFTPQIPLPSLREIRTDLTPVLEEAKKARQQHQERKRRALFTEEETKNANAVRTTTHTSSSSSSSSSSASLDDCLSCTTQEMPPSRLQPLRSDRMVGKFIHMICIATGLRRTYFTYPRPSWGCLSSPSTPKASFLDFHSLAIPVSAFPSLTVWFSHVLKAIAADRFLQTNISSPAPFFGTCLVVIGRQEEEDEEEGENNTTEAGSTARVSGTMSFSSPLLWRRLISSLSAVTPFVWQEEELESRIQKLIVHEFTSIYYIFQRNLSRENSCASSSGNAHSLRSSIADLTRLVKHYKCDNRDTCRIVLCPFIPSKE